MLYRVRLQFCSQRSNAFRFGLLSSPREIMRKILLSTKLVDETSLLLSCPMSPDVRTSSGLSAIWRSPNSNAKSANRDPPHKSCSPIPLSRSRLNNRVTGINCVIHSQNFTEYSVSGWVRFSNLLQIAIYLHSRACYQIGKKISCDIFRYEKK